MKITRQQLDELLRLITKSVLKEYTSMSSTANSNSNASDPGSADDGVKPADAQTSAEKAKARHDQQLKDKQALDQAKKEKETEKEKAESFKSQYDQWRRYGKQNDTKAVQDLQMKVADRGSGSSVAENIRKLRS